MAIVRYVSVFTDAVVIIVIVVIILQVHSVIRTYLFVRHHFLCFVLLTHRQIVSALLGYQFVFRQNDLLGITW